MWGQTGASPEEAREMVGAHVHQGTELREPKLPLQILLDVLCHTTESAGRQFATPPVDQAGRRAARFQRAFQ